MNAPVAGSTLTAPPPAEVSEALKDSPRPAVSVNAAVPVTIPVPLSGLPTVASPPSGVPGSTVTVTVWLAVRTPLEAVTVKVSVVDRPAACRCSCDGV